MFQATAPFAFSGGAWTPLHNSPTQTATGLTPNLYKPAARLPSAGSCQQSFLPLLPPSPEKISHSACEQNGQVPALLFFLPPCKNTKTKQKNLTPTPSPLHFQHGLPAFLAGSPVKLFNSGQSRHPPSPVVSQATYTGISSGNSLSPTTPTATGSCR